MNLYNKQLSFDYFTSNSALFATDFIRYVNTDVPLFALQDELLYLMEQRKATSFRIPGYKCSDGHDHTFHFKVESVNPSKEVKVFHYIGMDFLKENQSS